MSLMVVIQQLVSDFYGYQYPQESITQQIKIYKYNIYLKCDFLYII